MMKALLFSTFMLSGTFAIAPAANAASGGGGATATRLQCSAAGARDFSMDARYESRRGRNKFDASFEAAPGVGFNVGQRLTVSVGGVNVGSMTLLRDPANGDIVGDLEFDTRRDENNPFPANFPAVSAGVSVTVGSLGCALR